MFSGMAKADPLRGVSAGCSSPGGSQSRLSALGAAPFGQARRWLRLLMTPNMCWLATRSSLRKQQPLRREVIACGSGAAVTSLECALRCLSFEWNPSVLVLKCFLGRTSSSSHRTSSGRIRHPSSSLQPWEHPSPSLALSPPGAGTGVCLSLLSQSRWRHSLAAGMGAAPELLQPHT